MIPFIDLVTNRSKRGHSWGPFGALVGASDGFARGWRGTLKSRRWIRSIGDSATNGGSSSHHLRAQVQVQAPQKDGPYRTFIEVAANGRSEPIADAAS